MKVNQLLEKIKNYVKGSIVSFSIDDKLFQKADGRKRFNNLIRENVQDMFGVYIWCNLQADEIYYIGMAGKVRTNGTLSNHSLQKRLLASRGKDKLSKKDIQTNDFIKIFMEENNVKSIDFIVLYLNDGVLPTYLEAVLLYEYYKVKSCLPKLNNSF